MSARSKAWATRREKYGPSGHGGYYCARNSVRCSDCKARAMIVKLYADGTLSEGQASKATGLDRVALRKEAEKWRTE